VAKFADITDPTFTVELPDGTSKSYDLYDLGDQLAADDAEVHKAGGATFAQRTERLRKIFGIDSLTRAQAFHLKAEALVALMEVPALKKLAGLGGN
jgi:hypothetical protein